VSTANSKSLEIGLALTELTLGYPERRLLGAKFSGAFPGMKHRLRRQGHPAQRLDPLTDCITEDCSTRLNAWVSVRSLLANLSASLTMFPRRDAHLSKAF